MEENQNIEQPEVVTPEEQALENIPVPEGLKDVDPAKLAEARKKLAAFIGKTGRTHSGSEDPDSPEGPQGPMMGGVDGDAPIGQTMSGKDVKWDEYDLPYSVAHLYPKAFFRDTPQGPKWVVELDEYFSTERSAKSHGKQVNRPGAVDKTETEPLNLGEYVTQMVNGPDQWSLVTVLPGSMGNAMVLLGKKTAYVLPDPKPLQKNEEVQAPGDAELEAVEDAALQFAQEEGLTPPALVEDTVVEAPATEEVGLRPVHRDEVEVDETGSLPARASNLISTAIERNRQVTASADVPAGIQPPATEEGIPAGVENIRQGLKNLLDKNIDV